MITAKGVKPICSFKQVFQSTYLFGAFSPINGESFLLELPNCSAQTFQIFMDEFSNQNPDIYKIIVLDNGAFHKAKTLNIPKNISLIFLPPYSPELNPSEKIWQRLKRNFTNKNFESLDKISDFIHNEVKNLKKEIVISTCSYKYIFFNNIWTI